GWAEGVPNPRGYTTDRTFHARFESDFVDAHVSQADVSARVRGAPRSLAGRVRAVVWEHVRTSNAAVEELYRLEHEHGFQADRPASPAARDFAAERLAAGARLLADLWWTAWEESAAPAPDRR